MATNNSVNSPLSGTTGTGNFVGSTSPTLTGIISDNITWSDTTKGIVGTTTNNDAGAGYVGEYLSSTNSSGTTVSNVTATNITSLSLTAGDWDVYYLLNCIPANTGVINLVYTGITPTSVTIDLSSGAATWLGTFTGDGSSALVLNGSRRVSLSSTTTYYLVSYHSSSAGTLTTLDTGTIWARRVR